MQPVDNVSLWRGGVIRQTGTAAGKGQISETRIAAIHATVT